ncbi:hypothetical protein PAE9249_00753 [Paenibacillus sp. CECT 9249]|uniref:vWA domain-containing protein n=1 Tax=Paenibacillus sp. CECT 9249 TaxID=2845385 RepID=UPI001E653D64|nr:vWA domain-containing protein [Paenibacillus sp. CECT 9249]CAH0118268.1 hypothetical protein PAE9249_00753 [Paenibacillus sp. CECT 9249]
MSRLYLKRVLYLIFILTALVPYPASTFSTTYAAAGSATSKIDAVLTVDVSGSMNNSDKNKISNEAMKMFIDMLSAQGDKVGIVAYTDQIAREKALLEIRSAQDKEDLKTFIDQLVRASYTDIAVGVKEAVKVLQQGSEPDHVPLIVLLADGNNDFSKKSGRTQAQSDQDLNEALEIAQKNGYPIYTIGLNADGKLNKTVLEDISAQTNGKFFETSTADNLPQILSEIFASHLKLKIVPGQGMTGNGDFQEVAVPIPNANVIEANISIMSRQPVEVKLFDPSGQPVPLTDPNIVYTRSKTYSMIKIASPAMGDWKLQVKGANKDKIDINLIFNYDLELAMDPLTRSTFKAGDSVDVRSYLLSNGQKLQNNDIYKTMKATLVVKDLDTGEEEQVELANKTDHFAGSYSIPDAHIYEIKVRAEDRSFYRETAPVQIDAKTGAPANNGQSAQGAGGDEDRKPFPLLPVILGALGLIVAAAAAYAIAAYVKKANKGFVGQAVIEIRDNDTGDMTYPQYKKLNTFKGKFNLHQLLQLAPEFKETEKVIFTPAKNDGIAVRNLSGCTLEKGGRPLDASKGKELKSSERISVTMQHVNKTIFIEYIR